MFSHLPRRDRVLVKGTLTAGWGCWAVAGIGGVFLTATSLTPGPEPLIVIQVSSVVMFLASLAATFGVVSNRFAWEWIGAWFTAAGAATYVSLVWFATLGTPTRLQQAAIVTGMLCFALSRAFACAAHAKKLRILHETAVLRDRIDD